MNSRNKVRRRGVWMTSEEIKDDNQKLKDKAAKRLAQIKMIEEEIESCRVSGDFKMARINQSIANSLRKGKR